jgi:hypothetical protein
MGGSNHRADRPVVGLMPGPVVAPTMTARAALQRKNSPVSRSGVETGRRLPCLHTAFWPWSRAHLHFNRASPSAGSGSRAVSWSLQAYNAS